MKIALASDVHLEFGPLRLVNDDNIDTLILAGDICVAADIGQPDPHDIMEVGEKTIRYQEFFKNCSEQFTNVIYVAGNHEHYHGDIMKTRSILEKFLKPYTNIHYLEQDLLKIDDITFIGGTLWTDMNKGDPLTLTHIQGMMNDFRIIKNSSRPYYAEPYSWDSAKVGAFLPEDAMEIHKKTIEYIRLMIEGKHAEKFVMVGHHAPSKRSIHPRYKHDAIMNGGYSSELFDFIYDHPQIKAVVHGHVHNPFDYMINETRVLCNPRGYVGYEVNASDFQLKVFHI